MKERTEIEEKYKWDLSKYCKADDDFYVKLAKVTKKLDQLKKFEGKLSDDDVLLEYLNFSSKLEEELCFADYAYFKRCENNADRKANEMNEKLNTFFTKLMTTMTAIEVEIDKFSLTKLKKLQSNPKFKLYKRYFEKTIRHKKHALSKKEELLLSKIGEFTGGHSENFDKFSDVDLKFENIVDGKGKEYEFNQSKYSLYVSSNDRVLRRNAFKKMNGKFGEFINFVASNYINDVKEDCVLAKIRKYKSALAASIYEEEASESVYNMLVKKVRENVELQARYFEIKRKMLGLEKFAIYDTFAPVVGKSEDKYTFEEAIELIKNAVAVLGDDYVNLIQRAKDERWIDVFLNKYKDCGPFSSGSKGATPVVLMNFEGNLDSVFTLAHELGHAMHTYLSDKTQPIQTSQYVIFVAEVASNVNEMLLLDYLLDKAESDEEKIKYYDHFLVQMRSSIFRQTMFAEFEQFAHETYEKEEPLSAELLCEKYEELNNFYHGKAVEQIDEMKYEWARIPHFYRSFYVYKYATGLICAIKISSKLLQDKTFAKNYLEFLSSGSSKDPISLLKIADCDLTKEETFDDAFKTCEEFIEKWEKTI